MSKRDFELHQTEIILDEFGTYKRLTRTQLKTVPSKGDYYAEFSSKKVYEVKAVIHEDLHIILVVSETDSKYSDIISIIYS